MSLLHRGHIQYAWLLFGYSLESENTSNVFVHVWHLRTCFMVRPQHTGLDLLQEAEDGVEACTEGSWSDNKSAAAFNL